jgi:biotin carboxyl carrier protein
MKEHSQQDQNEAPELKKLMVQGDTYLTQYTKKYQQRQSWSKPDPKKVVSFIPGTIRQVLVRSGDIVAATDKLLVLEAMKMMNSIYSPIDGKIRSVTVKEGDRVPKGMVMIEFE